MPKIPVVMFSKTKILPDAYPQITKQFPTVIKDAELHESASLDSFSELIKSGSRAVLIYHVADREELMNILNFLPTVRQSLKDRRAVVAIFSKINSDKVEELLMKSGCTELLRYDISAKAFLYKLKRYLLFLKLDVPAEDVDVEVKGSGKPKEQAPDLFLDSNTQPKKVVGKNGQAVLIDPLKSKYDYWLIRKVPYVHRYKGQWMVEMIGPSPAAGKWRLTMKYQSLFPGEDMIWEWGLRDPPGKYGPAFDVSPATWLFTGKKPEYSWVVNRWAFLSTNPGLHLVQDGRILESRFFEDDEGLLEIARNSAKSDQLFEAIRNTFDPEYFLELEKLETNGLVAKIENPPSVPWADRSDSSKIPPAAWKQHDLTKEEGPEWNTDLPTPEDEEVKKGPAVDESADLDIPLGADAMRDCGVRASMDGEEIELMSYSEDKPLITIGTARKVKPMQEITILVESENMKYEDLNFTIVGVVAQVDDDENQRMIVTVALRPDSQKRLAKIRYAIEQRQAEIFEFFKRAKGVG